MVFPIDCQLLDWRISFGTDMVDKVTQDNLLQFASVPKASHVLSIELAGTFVEFRQHRYR